MGIISFIFGILGIISLIGMWFYPLIFFSPFSLAAIIYGGLTCLVEGEKRFSLVGLILGVIALVTLIIFFIELLSQPGL
jgi:hypothetical protein